jgi:cyclophilin family peptidyl-prolyl cis-trans isomerase
MPRQRGDPRGNESILPQHVSRSTSLTSLSSGEVSSSDESSSGTGSLWLSPTIHAKNQGKNVTLPTWSANPQSPGADTISSSGSVVSGRSSALVSKKSRGIPYTFVGFILVGILAIATFRGSLNRTTTQVGVFQHNRSEIEGKLRRYENDLRLLEREISALDFVVHKQQGLDDGFSHSVERHENAVSEMSDLQYRLQHEAEQAQHLKKQVQELSRLEIIEKYGNKVHLVEMELTFPGSNGGPNFFTIEMASIDLMPHSVHTFLDMVSERLLNGCSFILNALNVVKAAPLPYDGTSAAEKAKAFLEKGLESVVFKEYSEDFPHKKYTVGFAADGSPSFYINTADNSEIHVGDPCFGRVISGFDTIQRLAANPTRNGIWFERRIGIKSARIVTR